jgi:hypothetical protein
MPHVREPSGRVARLVALLVRLVAFREAPLDASPLSRGARGDGDDAWVRARPAARRTRSPGPPPMTATR